MYTYSSGGATSCDLFIGKNVVFLGSHFGWQIDEFVSGKVDLQNSIFLSNFCGQVADNEWCEAQLIRDSNAVCDNNSQVTFSDGNSFMASELNSLMLHVATNHTILNSAFILYHMSHIVISHCTTSMIL